MSATINAFIGPSGQTIVLRCVDGSGNPTLVTGINPDPTGLAFSINGGSFVPMTMPALWGTYSPSVQYNLPHSAPAFQYGLAGDKATFQFTNAVEIIEGGTASGRPFQIAGGQPGYLGFLWDRNPAGTYVPAVAYPHSGSNSNSVPYQIQDRSGGMIGSGTMDQTVAPSDFTYNGIGYKNLTPVTIASPNTVVAIFLFSQSATSGNILLDAGRLARTSSDISVNLLDTDSLRVQIPANYLTCVSGVVPAGIYTANNLVGGSSLDPFPADPTSTMLGYNVEGQNPFFGPCNFYTNLARRIGTPMGGQNGGRSINSNADGYPLTIDSPSLNGVLVDGEADDPGGLGKGCWGPQNGMRTVIWNGASDITAAVRGGVVTLQDSYTNLTGTTDNVRVFLSVGSALQFTSDFALNIHASGPPDDKSGYYPVDVTDLRIYGPDRSDPTGMTPQGISFVGGKWVPSNPAPPLFDEALASQVGAGHVVRWMDERGTNKNWICDYSDFMPTTALSRANQPPSKVFTSIILSITNIGEVAPHFCLKNYALSLVETVTPHNGYNYGTNVFFDRGGTATLTNSQTITFSGFSPLTVWVIDDYRFLMQYNAPGGVVGGSVMATPVGAGGTVTFTRGATMPLADMVAWSNTFNQAPWINIGFGQTLSCVQAEAAYYAANLKPGIPVYLEGANEVWNYLFPSIYCASDISYQFYLANDAAPWSATNPGGATDQYWPQGFVAQMKPWFAAWRSAWAAAGRDVNDIIGVVGVFGAGSNSVGTLVLEECRLQGLNFQMICTDWYLSNGIPGQAGSTAVNYAMDTTALGPALDMMELSVASGYLQYVAGSYRGVLDGMGYTGIKMANYEGSIGNLCPSGAGQTVFGGYIDRHPRILRIEQARIQAAQDAGFSVTNIFFASGIPGIGVGWPTVTAWDQEPGTGDPAIDTANVNTPFDWTTNIKSQKLGAHIAWDALYVPTPPPTRVTRPRRRQLT